MTLNEFAALVTVATASFLVIKSGQWVSDQIHDLRNAVSALDKAYTKLSKPGLVRVKSGKLTKSEPRAAGWDIHASEDIQIDPGCFATVATGVTTEMEDCDALILDKSGLAAKFWLTRRAGVIDEQYPLEWGVVMVNEGREPFLVKKGSKIANVIFIPKFNIEVEADGGEVVIVDKQREGGFGSTGA